MTPKEDREAATTMALWYGLAFLACAVVLSFNFLESSLRPNISVLELFGGSKRLLPVGILLLGPLHIQESWHIRTSRSRQRMLLWL